MLEFGRIINFTVFFFVVFCWLFLGKIGFLVRNHLFARKSWFFHRKKLGFWSKTIFFLRKKFVFWSVTIFLLGKSWFFHRKPIFSLGKTLQKKNIFLEFGRIVSRKMVFLFFLGRSWFLIGRVQCCRQVRARVEPERGAWRLVFDWKSAVLRLVELERTNGRFLLNVSLVLGSLGEIRNPDLREKLV